MPLRLTRASASVNLCGMHLPRDESAETWIYLVQAERRPASPIKIGRTKDPRTRLRILQTSHPVPLRYLALWRGGEKEERELHERFSYLRMLGEWFRPGRELRDFVRFAKSAPGSFSSAAEATAVPMDELRRLVNL